MPDFLKDKTLGGFVNEIKRATNTFNGQYYSKLIEQLENVFVDNDFIIEPITLFVVVVGILLE